MKYNWSCPVMHNQFENLHYLRHYMVNYFISAPVLLNAWPMNHDLPINCKECAIILMSLGHCCCNCPQLKRVGVSTKTHMSHFWPIDFWLKVASSVFLCLFQELNMDNGMGWFDCNIGKWSEWHIWLVTETSVCRCIN